MNTLIHQDEQYLMRLNATIHKDLQLMVVAQPKMKTTLIANDSFVPYKTFHTVVKFFMV